MADYQFTEDWFSTHTAAWKRILKSLQPTKILEIGSFEGRATCFIIENCAKYGRLDLQSIDTFSGDAQGLGLILNFDGVEERFDHNAALAIEAVGGGQACSLTKRKGFSHTELSALITQGASGYFDLIYVDGSHQAADVLTDCVLSFPLLRVGGHMILDDYLQFETLKDKRAGYGSRPKPAIDAFVNIFHEKLLCLHAPLYQLYLRKIRE